MDAIVRKTSVYCTLHIISASTELSHFMIHVITETSVYCILHKIRENSNVEKVKMQIFSIPFSAQTAFLGTDRKILSGSGWKVVSSRSLVIIFFGGPLVQLNTKFLHNVSNICNTILACNFVFDLIFDMNIEFELKGPHLSAIHSYFSLVYRVFTVFGEIYVNIMKSCMKQFSV